MSSQKVFDMIAQFVGKITIKKPFNLPEDMGEDDLLKEGKSGSALIAGNT